VTPGPTHDATFFLAACIFATFARCSSGLMASHRALAAAPRVSTFGALTALSFVMHFAQRVLEPGL
jgi:hypothetical protein